MIHTLFNIKKSILGIAAVASVLAFGFTACDELDENERFVEMPAQESKRNVLVEEFTGQKCTNCPDAHKALAALSEQYVATLLLWVFMLVLSLLEKMKQISSSLWV